MWNNTTPVSTPTIHRHGVVEYVVVDPLDKAEAKARHKMQQTRAKNRRNRKKKSR
jgi:hypothetical protein